MKRKVRIAEQLSRAEENPFMRLSYVLTSIFGRDDLEIDEALWYLKWRNEEMEK